MNSHVQRPTGKEFDDFEKNRNPLFKYIHGIFLHFPYEHVSQARGVNSIDEWIGFF